MRKLATLMIMEECRVPVVRPDFKSGRGCKQSLVGSTPILFRQDNAQRCPGRTVKNEGAQGPLAQPGKLILARRASA